LIAVKIECLICDDLQIFIEILNTLAELFLRNKTLAFLAIFYSLRHELTTKNWLEQKITRIGGGGFSVLI